MCFDERVCKYIVEKYLSLQKTHSANIQTLVSKCYFMSFSIPTLGQI